MKAFFNETQGVYETLDAFHFVEGVAFDAYRFDTFDLNNYVEVEELAEGEVTVIQKRNHVR